METAADRTGRERPRGLGNFLSGMETSGLEVLPAIRGDLGNFLSGMETSEADSAPLHGGDPWKLP